MTNKTVKTTKASTATKATKTSKKSATPVSASLPVDIQSIIEAQLKAATEQITAQYEAQIQSLKAELTAQTKLIEEQKVPTNKLEYEVFTIKLNGSHTYKYVAFSIDAQLIQSQSLRDNLKGFFKTLGAKFNWSEEEHAKQSKKQYNKDIPAMKYYMPEPAFTKYSAIAAELNKIQLSQVNGK